MQVKLGKFPGTFVPPIVAHYYSRLFSELELGCETS